MLLKFRCPMTNLVIEVKHESELPEGQVFERVEEGAERVYQHEGYMPGRRWWKRVYSGYVA